MTWLVLIWTALIVLWVNAERFAPAAKLRHLWQHAAAPIVRAAHRGAEQPPAE
jgi:hypothetical protein